MYRKIDAKEPLTQRERRVVYGGTDIYEFLTLATTSPEFQKEMSTVKYKNTNQTLLDKFREVIGQVLKGVGVQFESDSVAIQAINETFKLLESVKQEKSNTFEITSKDSNESLQNNVDKTLEIFGGEQGQVVTVNGQNMIVSNDSYLEEEVYDEFGQRMEYRPTINRAVIKYHYRPGGDGSKRLVTKEEHFMY